jgi:branched-chain amino acid aminotransferase
MGGLAPLCDAHVGILTHALHYGTGVFEGIRAYWDETREELFGLRVLEHFERRKQNCGPFASLSL